MCMLVSFLLMSRVLVIMWAVVLRMIVFMDVHVAPMGMVMFMLMHMAVRMYVAVHMLVLLVPM